MVPQLATLDDDASLNLGVDEHSRSQKDAFVNSVALNMQQ
jgi:hypothetical protein